MIPSGFNRADWKAAAHAPWAFTHTDTFLPTAEIAAACTATLLPAHPLPIFADPAWPPRLAAMHATSALVVTRAGLAAEWYRTPGDGERRHMLFSVTKSLIGLLALMLIEDGQLDPEAAVEHYAPDLAGSAFGAARVGALLAMRDGIPFDERYGEPDAAIHLYSRHYWGAGEGGTLAALRRLPAAAPTPGFAYRTPVADALGWAIRGATGDTLEALLARRLWQPLGAEHGAHLIRDTGGHAIAGTGFNARPRDLARLARLLLTDGGGVIAPAIVGRLFASSDAVVPDPGRPGWSYDAMWWKPRPGRIAAIGVHGQRLTIDRTAGVALVMTGAAPRPDNRPLEHHHSAAFEAVLAALG
jgi:hypothetical protein